MTTAAFWDTWLTGKFQSVAWYSTRYQRTTSIVTILEDFFLLQHGRGEEFSLDTQVTERQIMEKLGSTPQERLDELRSFLTTVPEDSYHRVRLFVVNLSHHIQQPLTKSLKSTNRIQLG